MSFFSLQSRPRISLSLKSQASRGCSVVYGLMARSMTYITSLNKNIYEATINYFSADAMNKKFRDIIDSLSELQEQLKR